MVKFASIAMSAAIGLAGGAHSLPAEAHPSVVIGIGYPGVAVVAPVGFASGYYAPYYHPAEGYWRRDYDRERAEHEHRWDRDRRHWDYDRGHRGERR